MKETGALERDKVAGKGRERWKVHECCKEVLELRHSDDTRALEMWALERGTGTQTRLGSLVLKYETLHSKCKLLIFLMRTQALVNNYVGV